MTSPIIDFIEARLAEDEATAMAAEGANWGQRRDRMNPYVIHDVDAYKPGILYTGRIIAAEKLETRDHIVRHDPARVLREVTAKRALLEHHGDQHECTNWELASAYPYVGCSVLRELAAVYSDHPEFDPEWTVTA